MQDPKRLFHRYLKTNVKYLFVDLAQRRITEKIKQ